MGKSPTSANRNKVLIVAPLGYVASIPFMMEAVRHLIQYGCVVHFVVPAKLDPQFKSSGDGVILTEIQEGNNRISRKLTFLWRYVIATRKILRENEISAIAGLSQLGVIISALAVSGTGTKLVYLNDELWFNDYKTGLFYYPLKCLERLSNRRAFLTVTQDKYRGRLLSVINSIDKANIAYLPNSRSGPAGLSRSHLLHDIIGCPRDTKIILWNGAASEGDGALEMANAAVHWTDEFLFVFHFRSRQLSGYKEELVNMHQVGRNYYLSREFDYFDLDDVFASAHIGIAHYPDKGINSRYIASSSGKINSFLRIGVPCIVSRLPGLHWVEKSGAGLMIDAPHGITDAVSLIDANYSYHCKSALEIFDEILQFDSSFNSVFFEMMAES